MDAAAETSGYDVLCPGRVSRELGEARAPRQSSCGRSSVRRALPAVVGEVTAEARADSAALALRAMLVPRLALH